MGILNIASKEKMEELILLQQIRDLASHGEDSFVYEDNETMAKLFNSKEAMNNTVSGSYIFKYGANNGMHVGNALSLIDDIGVASWSTLNTVDAILADASALTEVFNNRKAFDYMKRSGFLKYIPVDYIETSGTQFIDTGIVGKSGLKAECQVMYTSTTDGFLLGSVASGWTSRCYMIGHSSSKFKYGYINEIVTGTTLNTNQMYEIATDLSVGKQSVTINGEVVSTGTNSTEFNNGQNLYLFANNGFGTLNGPISAKLYGCKIYDGDTLVRDFVPAKDFSGVICLYDKVTKQFFYNAGTGDFLYDHTHDYGDTWLYNETHHWKACSCGNKDGLDIHKDIDIDGICDVCNYKLYTPVKYLQSTGTQWFDTGYNPSNNTVIEVKASTTTGNFYTDCWNAGRFGLYLVQSGRIDAAFGQSGYMGSTISGLTEPMEVRLSNGLVEAGGKSYTFATQADFTVNKNLVIFADNKSSGTTPCPGGELYDYKIYEGDELKHHYIPVLDLENVPCLYDTVNGTFLYNSGTDQFAFSCINHSISDTYNYDMTTHWNECEVCGEKFNVEDHVDSDGDNICDICGGSTLPYVPVDYVLLDNNAVIDTGIGGSTSQTYELDFQLYSTTASHRYLLYSDHDNYSYGTGISFSGNKATFRALNRYAEYQFTNKNITLNEFSDRMRLLQRLQTGYILLDGQVLTNYKAELSSVCDTNLFIGGYSENGTSFSKCTSMRIYGCKVYKAGFSETLVRDFVPAKDAEGKACLYDKVSGTFFYNVNKSGGTITAGPEV